MARGVNKVILVGNLGADPDVRYTQGGDAIANISLATSLSWKDKETGEQQEQTEWHRVVFFKRLAEIVAEYLKKGSQIYVEGRLRTRKWQDKDGNDRYTTEVVAGEMQMLGSRPDSNGVTQTQATTTSRSKPAAAVHTPPPVDDFDDDIPFARPAALDGICYAYDGAPFGNGPMNPYGRSNPT